MDYKKENPFLQIFDINSPTKSLKWKLNDTTVRYLGSLEYRIHKRARKDNKNNKKYRDLDVSYTLNKFGYRTKYDYPPDVDYILVCGCSYSFGHSIPEDFRYSNIIEKKLEMPVINISASGGSANLMKDNLLQLLISGHRLPSIIISQWPYPERYWISQTPYSPKDKGFIDGAELDKISRHAFETFNYLCRLHNINLLNFKIEKDSNDYKIPYIFEERHDFLDRGRDNIHPGTMTHKHIARKIIEFLQEKNIYRSNI